MTSAISDVRPRRDASGRGAIYIVLVLVALVVILVLGMATQMSIDRERGRGRFSVDQELLLRERFPGGRIIDAGGDQVYIRCEPGGWEMRYYPDHRRLPFYERLCW